MGTSWNIWNIYKPRLQDTIFYLNTNYLYIEILFKKSAHGILSEITLTGFQIQC